MKRVAIIVPGGIGSGNFDQGIPALTSLIEGLSKMYDITVYSLVFISPEFEPKGYSVKSLKAKHNDWTTGRVIRLTRRILKDHRKSKFDLFHGFWGMPGGSMAVLLGKLFKRPSIVSLQGGEVADIQQINYGYLINKRKKKILLKTLNAASKVTALTEFQRNKLVHGGYTTDNITVIPYGVNTSIFTPKKKEYNQPINFLHVANLTEVKDQVTLLKAFKLIRNSIDCKLKIVGFDALNGEIQKLCSEYGLDGDVSFIGPVSHKDIPGYMNWAHILLHTSLYESQAVVVAEAMASNVLVAGTNVGLMSDLKHIAITAPCQDHQAIAEKVLAVLQDESKIKAIQIEGQKWTESNNRERTFERFDNLYNELMYK